MRKLTLSVLALAAALVTGSALAEDASDDAQAQPAAAAPVHAGAAWWTALPDPVLATLIQQGLESNLDLVQAHARVRRSQALLAGARAAFGPTGSVGINARSALASEAEAPGMSRAQRRTDSVGVGLDFSWEIDLFGRLRGQEGAAAQRFTATRAQAQGVRLAISTEIAHAYFALQGAREQLQLARQVADNRQRTLRVVEARSQGGLAAPIDDLRARAELESALAEIPVHEAAAQVAIHRLAVLTGSSPNGFTVAGAETVQPASVAIRLPDSASWLAQRPDVQEMEAELRARALDVGAIRAELFPRLTISGVLGFVAGSVTGLGSGGILSWLGAPSLLAPLLDRPRIEARLAAAKAHQKEAVAAYRQRVLLATEEVENALTRYSSGQQQFNALQRRMQHAVQAERLARVRYEAGAADLLELLDAQRSGQQAQVAVAQTLMQQRQNLVAVFKAVGGHTE